MSRKRSVPKSSTASVPTLPEGRTVSDQVSVHGRILRAGDEFQAVEHGSRPERRRRLVQCRFLCYVQTPTSSWVEATDDRRRFRAFYLDRIVTGERTPAD